MVNFYDHFLNCDKSRKATLQDVVAHINYIRKLIGPDHIGIGADYEGVDEVPSGLEDVSKFPNLFDRLYESRKKEPKWRREELEKLAGRNFIRVFQAVEDIRDSLMASESPREDIISSDELRNAQKAAGVENPGQCQSAIEWKNVNP